MAYPAYHRKRRRAIGAYLGTAALVICSLVIFGFGVYYFRFLKPEQAAEAAAAATSALPPVPEAFGFESDTKDPEAHLRDVSGGSATGTATRGQKDGHFYHTLKTSLPEIDRVGSFYEGWLVQPIPYEFFSTGEMVTNNLGEFVLEWNGEEGREYSSFTGVIVTLELRDGNPDPSKHVLRGEFGDE